MPKVMPPFTIHEGDCLEILRELPANSVDALVTDPPAGIQFMGAAWDSNKGGRTQWINWMRDRLIECRRVMKPGAYGLIWSIPRTSHWTGMAAELAGFEVQDQLLHIFGQGMPHGYNVALAIDKKLGVESEITGTRFLTGNAAQTTKEKGGTYATNTNSKGVAPKEVAIKRAASPEGKQWEGWNTALKPGVENWWLVQKPIEEDTIAEQVMASGTGAINVTETRVEGKRWPANVVLSHSDNCIFVGKKKVKAAPPWNEKHKDSSFTGKATSKVHHSDGDGKETVNDWECVDGCPVHEIGKQSGTRRTNPPSSKATSKTHKNSLTRYSVARSLVGGGDTGTAARYFNQFLYCSKASRSDKDFGGVVNDHPTPKSLTLMDWLCTLITPPGGSILDPFCGSGSTGVAALKKGYSFIGIELSEDYANLSKKRLSAVDPIPRRKRKSA